MNQCNDPDHGAINAERAESRGLRKAWVELDDKRQELLGKIDRIERERDEYKGLLIELHNDINVIHSGNAIAKLNKMFKEENYN
jgi:hypothetical protein